MEDYRLLEARILEFIEDENSISFDELALAIHKFQKKHCAPLRAYCEAVAPAPRSWREIPAVPTEAFKDAERPIACFPPERATRTFLTSGTTAETRGVHRFLDTRLYDASVRATWKEFDLPDLPLICLSQPPGVDSSSSLAHMFDALGGRFAIGTDGRLRADRIATLLERAPGPVVLAGTALAFLHLFESSVTLPSLKEGSWALETGGYKGSGRELDKRELYAMFNEHLGLPAVRVINEYGMTELSSVFLSTGLQGIHHGPRWTRVRVLAPGGDREVAEGETGLLAICDLANLGSSIAIMTRDLAVRRGDHFVLVGRDPAALPRGCSRSVDELLSQ